MNTEKLIDHCANCHRGLTENSVICLRAGRVYCQGCQSAATQPVPIAQPVMLKRAPVLAPVYHR